MLKIKNKENSDSKAVKSATAVYKLSAQFVG